MVRDPFSHPKSVGKLRRVHYLELCRLFVARHFRLALDKVETPSIPQAVHEGLEAGKQRVYPDPVRNLHSYTHQIDLYWEASSM